MNLIDKRGSALFSSDALNKIFNETVVPELDDTHGFIGVGVITKSGTKAAIIYHRSISMFGLKGEWMIEGAFLYDWSGAHDAEARILFKL